jgi:hypothetical protein
MLLGIQKAKKNVSAGKFEVEKNREIFTENPNFNRAPLPMTALRTESYVVS